MTGLAVVVLSAWVLVFWSCAASPGRRANPTMSLLAVLSSIALAMWVAFA